MQSFLNYGGGMYLIIFVGNWIVALLLQWRILSRLGRERQFQVWDGLRNHSMSRSFDFLRILMNSRYKELGDPALNMKCLVFKICIALQIALLCVGVLWFALASPKISV